MLLLLRCFSNLSLALR